MANGGIICLLMGVCNFIFFMICLSVKCDLSEARGKIFEMETRIEVLEEELFDEEY